MVYKKYIKRRGKVFGPYYYESYRDKKGNVKTRFISGPKRKDKIISKLNINKNLYFISGIVLIFILTILILKFNFGIFTSTAKSVTGFAIEGYYGGSGCSDSDGGQNYNVKGTTSDQYSSSTDVCSAFILYEYYCSGDSLSWSSYDCSASGRNCYDGKCCSPRSCIDVGRSCGTFNDGCGYTIDCGDCPEGQNCVSGNCAQGCVDSDGGNEPYEKGRITGYYNGQFVTYDDFCIFINSERVMEYYCSSDTDITGVLVKCPEGCVEGEGRCYSAAWSGGGVDDDDDDDDPGNIRDPYSTNIDNPATRLGGFSRTLSECIPDWECEEWSKCEIVYDYKRLAEGRTLLEGEQSSFCVDKNKCAFDSIQKKICDPGVQIYAERIEKCFKHYVEIYDNLGTLISRLELTGGTYQNLNVQMLFDRSAYCPYCYDGIKNHDEDEVDCVNSDKGSCMPCSIEIPLLKRDYALWLSLIILILAISINISWYLLLLIRGRNARFY